jgi:hypothetical protein
MPFIKILTRLYKSLNEFDYYKQMKFNSERLVFLVDSKTKSINMKSLETASFDSKAATAFNACEIKSQKSLIQDQFYRVNSNFNLNSKFKTPNVKAHNLTKEDFYVFTFLSSIIQFYNHYLNKRYFNP